jgi:hypothetical protein
MEPVSIVAISAAVGGVAGELVKRAWALGEKWLSSYFKDHLPKAQESAKQNALQFLDDLARRVHILEAKAAQEKGSMKSVEAALEDPDFSALLQKAILTSSRTDNLEKHRILSRIVAERLSSASEDLVTLTSSLACDAIEYLGIRHLHTLGVCITVFAIRPDPFPPPTIPKEVFWIWYLQWWQKRLAPMLDNASCTQLDLLHLMGASCIHYEPVITRDLKQMLSPPKESGLKWQVDEFITKNPTGVNLNQLWEQGLKSVTPTSVGQLIGIYVADELTGGTTKIDW